MLKVVLTMRCHLIDSGKVRRMPPVADFVPVAGEAAPENVVVVSGFPALMPDPMNAGPLLKAGAVYRITIEEVAG